MSLPDSIRKYCVPFLAASAMLIAINATPAWSQDRSKTQPTTVTKASMSQLWKRKPRRRDTPLREHNIDAVEVQQIEDLMNEMFPGSVVYISAVTTGCPCEDGPNCEDQVWSIASNTYGSRELALSKIDGAWQVGPLQQWWLIRDELWQKYRASRELSDDPRKIDYQEYARRQMEHDERYPSCTVVSSD